MFVLSVLFYCLFFFNDTATTEIYTLSLHDALPISPGWPGSSSALHACGAPHARGRRRTAGSTTRRRRTTSGMRSEEHTSELQSPDHLVCRLLLEKKKKNIRSQQVQMRSHCVTRQHR